SDRGGHGTEHSGAAQRLPRDLPQCALPRIGRASWGAHHLRFRCPRTGRSGYGLCPGRSTRARVRLHPLLPLHPAQTTEGASLTGARGRGMSDEQVSAAPLSAGRPEFTAGPRTELLRFAPLAAVVAGLLAAVYWPALRGPFVWDDLMLVHGNPLVTGK